MNSLAFPCHPRTIVCSFQTPAKNVIITTFVLTQDCCIASFASRHLPNQGNWVAPEGSVLNVVEVDHIHTPVEFYLVRRWCCCSPS